MKIESADISISKMLSQGWYNIPRFQRPYSWENEEISEFWNDTVVENKGAYFIGSMVIFENGDSIYGIVDGQQRLTTITIMLCALRDVFYKYNFQGSGNGVHTKIEKENLESQKEFVLKTETSFPYFQGYVQSKDKIIFDETVKQEEKNICDAYKYFFEEIKNHAKKNRLEFEEALKTIRDSILNLKVVQITLDNEEDAYLIFEILNARGRDLDPADLIKNHLFRHIKNGNSTLDSPQEKWKMMVSTIQQVENSVKIEEFLHHFWMSKYAYVTKKELYKKFKSTVTAKTAHTMLDEIYNDSKTYAKIIDSNQRDWKREEIEIYRSLEAFSTFRITQQMPAILSLLRSYEKNVLNLKHLKRCLKFIEKFHFMHTAVCSGRSSGSIATMYSDFGRRLSNCSELAEATLAIKTLREGLKKKKPKYETFSSQFETIGYRKGLTRQKKVVLYILESFYKYDSSGAYPDRSTNNIEHILSQSTANTDEELNHISMVGNLIICPDGVNLKMANKSFNAKKKILSDNKCLIPSKIKNATTWNYDNILDRTRYMSEKAYHKIWNF